MSPVEPSLGRGQLDECSQPRVRLVIGGTIELCGWNVALANSERDDVERSISCWDTVGADGN